MNERIKELHTKVLDESENMRWNIEDAEKFAELIIRECATVVQETRWMVQPSQEQIANRIKQHFGVDE